MQIENDFDHFPAFDIRLIDNYIANILLLIYFVDEPRVIDKVSRLDIWSVVFNCQDPSRQDKLSEAVVTFDEKSGEKSGLCFAR